MNVVGRKIANRATSQSGRATRDIPTNPLIGLQRLLPSVLLTNAIAKLEKGDCR